MNVDAPPRFSEGTWVQDALGRLGPSGGVILSVRVAEPTSTDENPHLRATRLAGKDFWLYTIRQNDGSTTEIAEYWLRDSKEEAW